MSSKTKKHRGVKKGKHGLILDLNAHSAVPMSWNELRNLSYVELVKTAIGVGLIKIPRDVPIGHETARKELKKYARQVESKSPTGESGKAVRRETGRQSYREQSKVFYASDEWRRLRYRVLKTYGKRCMCCGASPETGAIMHVDHIKPRYTHPELSLSFDNLQVLCEDCNMGKGAWDSTDHRSTPDLSLGEKNETVH